MAKITIIIQDKGDMVDVQTKPDFRKLKEIAKDKGRDLTPAVAYALAALTKIANDSREQLKEQLKERVQRGDLTPFNKAGETPYDNARIIKNKPGSLIIPGIN